MSTTRDDTRLELTTRLETYLGMSFPTVKAIYTNHKISYPVPPTVFITVEIDEFQNQQSTLGQPKNLKMSRGFWIIEVYAPENTGGKMATILADGLDTEFGGTTFKTINCDTITLGHSVMRDDRLTNGWHRWTLMFPYRTQQVG